MMIKYKMLEQKLNCLRNLRVIARKTSPIWHFNWNARVVIGHNFGGMKPIDLKFLLKMTNLIAMRFLIFEKYPKNIF